MEKLLRVSKRVGELWECAKDSERGRAQKGSECVHMRVLVWCFCARTCDLGGIGSLWGIVGLVCCCDAALIVTMAANEIENEMWKASTVGGAFQVSGFI